ncbi:MAG TPA: hypothetical protein VMT23_02025 [Candidatus Binatia bacterium]|nr:hypothetical protein [Candidatus Binatia bacterium]
MQWWMWVIAVILIVLGIVLISFGFSDEEPGSVIVGLLVVALAVLGIIYFKHWRPEQHRQHAQAVAETKYQGFVTEDLSNETFDVGAYAGKCLIPLQRHKVDGVYRLEIFKRVNVPGGATTLANVPVDKQFLRSIGNLAVCR